MIWLRLFLLGGLVAHKAVWEVLRRGSNAPSEPFRPIKALKIGALSLFLAQAFLPSILPITPQPGFSVVIGALLFTTGLALAITGRVQLGRNWANVESATVLPGQQLVAHGLYREIRHPIYFGDLLLVTGFEFALNSWLVLLALPLAGYIWIKAAQEERLLAGRLPGYPEYLRTSGRFLPRAAQTGVLAAILAFAVQLTLVTMHYNGNWSGLYVHGSQVPMPSQIEAERPYVFLNSTGYDGQFYHVTAHDPFLAQGLWRWMDNGRLRYPRILLPALAYLLALGRGTWIDPALYTIEIACFGLGAFWLACFAESRQRSPVWGLAFFAIPTGLISLERITVDLPLLALACGVLYYAARGAHRAVFATLTLAVLARETGLLLWGSYGLFLLFRREWLRAITFGLAAVPLAAWVLWVFSIIPPHIGAGGTHYVARPDDALYLYSSFIHRFFLPVHYDLPPLIARAAMALDYLSLTGTLLGAILAIRWFRAKPLDPLRITAAVWGAFPFLIGGVIGLYEPFGYPRTLSPLFAVLLLAAIDSRQRAYLIPIAMVLPRIMMQLAPKIPGVAAILGR